MSRQVARTRKVFCLVGWFSVVFKHKRSKHEIAVGGVAAGEECRELREWNQGQAEEGNQKRSWAATWSQVTSAHASLSGTVTFPSKPDVARGEDRQKTGCFPRPRTAKAGVAENRGSVETPEG